jgi:hypothetical protein
LFFLCFHYTVIAPREFLWPPPAIVPPLAETSASFHCCLFFLFFLVSVPVVYVGRAPSAPFGRVSASTRNRCYRCFRPCAAGAVLQCAA